MVVKLGKCYTREDLTRKERFNFRTTFLRQRGEVMERWDNFGGDLVYLFRRMDGPEGKLEASEVYDLIFGQIRRVNN
ncbi:hypothetical protein J4402_01900 [Candidatus Pacearchaeota archaeon]|nr:hypothetical protein [uncultured archaeon]AQS31817.1 hypothetical protein [uncultured archaeon]MBS3088512.1 hypothetical protein [Candidatus Pacearchaeota archaeon]